MRVFPGWLPDAEARRELGLLRGGIAICASMRIGHIHLLRTVPGSYMSLEPRPLAGQVQCA